MVSLDDWTDQVPAWLWPESRSRQWIHGIGLTVVGGTFLFWGGLATWGVVSPEPDVPIWIRVFGFASALSIGATTALIVAVPYVLGSLAASTARRPAWIAGGCGTVALLSLSFRAWAYGVAGGEQAFVLVVLLAVPYSALVMVVWAADLWRRYWLSEKPVLVRSFTVRNLAAVVSIAALMGATGSVAGWLLRNSSLWMVAGGLPAVISLGGGLWAAWRARQGLSRR